MRFLLRVEAVNLAAFISDTQDISTIRGASLILLNWVEELPNSHPELSKVFTGASSGVFEFEAENETLAEEFRRSLAAELAGPRPQDGKDNGQYATFQVAIAPLDDERIYQRASAEALTRIRVQQLQSPTVILPKASEEWAGICEVDDIRPAVKEIFRQGGVANQQISPKMKVSRATLHRRPYGIDEKHSFLVKRRACGQKQDVVNDFEQLTDYPKAGLLHRKLALISLDGNKFGRFARNCRTPDEARAWASFVQHNQDAFLHHLLRTQDQDGEKTPWRWSGNVITNNGSEKTKSRVFRLEVLRWAGDDLLLVVPAWCGWQVLTDFYGVFGTLPWPPEMNNPTGRNWTSIEVPQKVTHSGCIIFAHHNAPIQPLIALAEALVIEAKKLEGNAFAYQVLESFDHLGADQNRVRLHRFPRLLRDYPELLILNGEHMQGTLSSFKEISKRVPRKAIYEVLKALHCAGAQDTDPTPETLKRYRVDSFFQSFRDALIPNVLEVRLRNAAAWFHLSELWDYIRDPADLSH